MSHSLTSRGLTGYAGAVLAGGISAALFAFALAHASTVLIFLSYLAPVPLFVAGFGAGALAAVLASATGMAGLYFHFAASSPEHVVSTVSYAVIMAIPACLFTALAIRPEAASDAGQGQSMGREGKLLSVAVLYPCFLFVLAFVLTWHDGGSSLLAKTTDVLDTMRMTVETAMKEAGRLGAEEILVLGLWTQILAQVIPAITGWAWIMLMIVTSTVAQRMLVQNNWNLRPSLNGQNIQLPSAILYAAAASGLVACFAPGSWSYLGTNLFMILFLPLFVVGLVIIHAWARTTRAPRTVLTLFYVVLSVVLWMAFAVALLGILDQWMNFRRRLASGAETTN